MSSNYRSHVVNPRRWPKGANRVPVNERTPKLGHVVATTANIALLHEHERELLYYLVKLGGPGDYANLGHARGASAVLFAQSLIDHGFKGMVESVDVFSAVHHWRSARRKLVDYGVRDRVSPRRGTTDSWGNNFVKENRKFRGLFIDADHSYEWVKKDFLLWSPMVEKGGFVCFHDTNQEFSNRVMEECVIPDPTLKERKDLHVVTIRVFFKQ